MTQSKLAAHRHVPAQTWGFFLPQSLHTYTLTSCLFLSCGEITVRIPVSFTFVRDINKLGQILLSAVCYNSSQLLRHSSMSPCTSQAAVYFTSIFLLHLKEFLPGVPNVLIFLKMGVMNGHWENIISLPTANQALRDIT